ncbi:MAG: biopolymer transporter ExbD [Candidatus Schekmanbacteria bacterium]|nr:biopolymer transporter ExbD [Candidatus Schekmanbacteria bacterium]
MKFRKLEPPKPEIQLTSLIDVVLQLVIFFMLTTHFVQQAGIDVKLPKAAATKAKPVVKELYITISKENQIYLDKDMVTLEQLPQRLSQLIKADANKKLVVIRADQDVRHGTVVHVMDLSKRLGVETLAIATEVMEEEPPPVPKK